MSVTISRRIEIRSLQTLIHPWNIPLGPADFTALFEGKILNDCGMDAFFPLIGKFSDKNCKFNKVIEKFGILFSVYGIPDSLVTDNGTFLVSEKMKKVKKNLKIIHIWSTSYHSRINRIAERPIQTFKNHSIPDSKERLNTIGTSKQSSSGSQFRTIG